MRKLKNIALPKFKKEEKKKDGKNKLIVFRRKQVVAASLVALIGIAGYLNWSFQTDVTDESIAVMYNEASKKLGEAQMVTNNDAADSEETENNEDVKASNNYFAQAKIDREVKRDEAVEMLTNVLNSTESTEEAKVNAQTEIFTLAEYTQKEVNAENLIKARGYDNAVVFMTAEGANVAVECEGLTDVDAAVISEAVSDSTAVDVSCIKIVEIAPEG